MKLHDDPDLATEHGAVRRELVLPVSREQAWPLLVEPAELETWLADEVELEIREGAEGFVRWSDGDERRAVVEEVVAERRVALRWWAPDADPREATLVELTLDDDPAGTRLAIVELPLRTLQAVGTTLPGGAPATGPQLALACA
jgi:uncharacterized protein YndB with AHSA1/START domain